MRIMAERARQRQQLHHPGDLRFRPPAGFHSGRRLPRYALEAGGALVHLGDSDEEDA
jgi:hypothetical protein